MINLSDEHAETLISALLLAIEYTKTEAKASDNKSHSVHHREQLSRYTDVLAQVKMAADEALLSRALIQKEHVDV